MKQNVQKNFIYRYDNTYLDCFPTSISYGKKSHTSTKRYIFGISDVDQPHPDSSAVSRPLGSSNFTRSTAILSGFQHIALMKALKEAWIPLLPLALADGASVHKKDPVEQAAMMILQTWDIFEVLHGDDCKTTQLLNDSTEEG